MKGGDLSGDLAAWGGKHVGRIVRLALLLHMAEHGVAGKDLAISRSAVTAALRIGDFIVKHNRAVYGVADTENVKLADLVAAMDYLWRQHTRHPMAAITVRQIGKSGPDALRRKSNREPVLDMLADLNLIARKLVGGQRVVYVHPKVGPRFWSVNQ